MKPKDEIPFEDGVRVVGTIVVNGEVCPVVQVQMPPPDEVCVNPLPTPEEEEEDERNAIDLEEYPHQIGSDGVLRVQ